MKLIKYSVKRLFSSGSRSYPAIAILLPLALLSGCKIIQEVGRGGSIVSDSGDFDCPSQTVCTIDVENGQAFKDTFAAVPEPGYQFFGWAPSIPGEKASLCGGSKEPCVLSASPEFTDNDSEFYLEPIFGMDLDRDGIANAQDNDLDGDGVRNGIDIFPRDVSQLGKTIERICLGPDWIDDERCFEVNTNRIGGRNQSTYRVNKPGVLSVDVAQRRQELASLPPAKVNQYCSDTTASADRLPDVSARSVDVHVYSWDGESIGIPSHIEAAEITLGGVSLASGAYFDQFTFQVSLAVEANTVDFSIDPGANDDNSIPGLERPFYFLARVNARSVQFGTTEDLNALNALPVPTRELFFSLTKNLPNLLRQSNPDVSFNRDNPIDVFNSAKDIADLFEAFPSLAYQKPELPPLEEMWCSDDFDTCREYLPNWEFRDTMVNYGADYLAFANEDLGRYLLQKMRFWAESRAFLNVRNVELGETWQDDVWPRYETNMVLVSVLEAWSLLRQDGLPTKRDIDLIENWLGEVLSFTALTTSGGPGGIKNEYNLGYLESSLKMAWGALKGIDQLFVEGLEHIYLALHQMNKEGGFPREIARGGAAYSYQNLTAMHVMYMANLAVVQGYDVFKWSVDGKTLHTMADFSIRAAQDPAMMEEYALEHNYPYTPLPINYEATLAVDQNGRDSKYSRGKSNGAWFEVYLALNPSATWQSDLDGILFAGLENSRPFYHEVMGANTTCYLSQSVND